MPPLPLPDVGDALADLEALVGHSSWSRSPKHLEACADAVGAFFEPLGDVEVVPVAPSRDVDPTGRLVERRLGPVVRVTARPDAARSVLLVGHYDTVFPSDSGFEGMHHDGDVVRGPGVVDAKGGLVVAHRALQLLEEAGADLGWELLVVGDEEIGSPGSAAVLAAAAGRHDLGLGYEPSMPDGALAAARPGSANLVHVVRGRAAHAGRELDAGRNALLAAGALASGIDGLRDHPDLLANPAVLTAGTAPNIVPDLAILRSNIRAVTAESADHALAQLDVLVAALAVDGITIEQYGGFGRPPKEMTASYRHLLEVIGDQARRLGFGLEWRDTGGVCDGNVLAGAGLTNVDNLGPVGGDLHRETEYLRPVSLAERARLSGALLISYDRGEWEMTT